MKTVSSAVIRIGAAVAGLAASVAVAVTATGPTCCAETTPGQCPGGGIATDCKTACPVGQACWGRTGCLNGFPWALASCIQVPPANPAGPPVP